MRDFVLVTGIVLKTGNLLEYDRRLVLLTRERGKITVFARGARRQNSSFMASCTPFSFGEFKLYEGKSAYNLMEVSVKNYFEELRSDYMGACYGMYFLEIADFYGRENNDEFELLKLLYQSLKALSNSRLPDRLIRCIYEIKVLCVNGEFPGIPGGREFLASTVYAVQFIESSAVEKLYTFTVSDEVLTELSEIAERLRLKYIGGNFKSLSILEEMGL